MSRLLINNINFSYNYVLKVYSYFNIFWAIFGIFVRHLFDAQSRIKLETYSCDNQAINHLL
jgi:hypothetical protein